MPEGARLGADRESVSFEALSHAGDPAPVTVTLLNSGTGTLAAPTLPEIRFEGDASGWLTAALNDAGPPYTVTLTVSVGSLFPGDYQASVILQSPGAVHSPFALPVTLHVRGPALLVDTQVLRFHARLGGEPPPQEVFATRYGVPSATGGDLAKPTASVHYASGGSDWLSVSVGGQDSVYGITATASLAGLAPGHYAAQLEVASEGAGGSPAVIPVYLHAGPWFLTHDLVPKNLLTPIHATTATLLPSGQVLVTDYAISELYDPANDTWSLSGALNVSRGGHVATALDDGRVLATGGFSASGSTSWEIYDPASGIWSPPGVLPDAFQRHTATRLADGRVLLAAGDAAQMAGVADLFDPATGVASRTGTMTAVHGLGAGAVRLADGKVLVAGGVGAPEVAELYDPQTGTWSRTGSMGADRVDPALVLLQDGRVLAAGGSDLGQAELYDPAAGTWSPTGSMAQARSRAPAVALSNGKVLIAGGMPASLSAGAPGAELYDPAAGTWSSAGDLQIGRADHQAVLLPGDRVLVVGGVVMMPSLVVPPGEAPIDDDEILLGTAEIWLGAAP